MAAWILIFLALVWFSHSFGLYSGSRWTGVWSDDALIGRLARVSRSGPMPWPQQDRNGEDESQTTGDVFLDGRLKCAADGRDWL